MIVMYLIGSPLVPLDGEVPLTVWIGRDVFYKHLRVFGCLAYTHIARDQRSKLDIKTTKPCIFLGHSKDENIVNVSGPIFCTKDQSLVLCIYKFWVHPFPKFKV